MDDKKKIYEMKIVLDDGTTFLFYDQLEALEERMQTFKPMLSKAYFKKIKA